MRKIVWKDAGVVEQADLESLYTRKGIGGSNPPPSAKIIPLKDLIV